jgi:hypothetical protein
MFLFIFRWKCQTDAPVTAEAVAAVEGAAEEETAIVAETAAAATEIEVAAEVAIDLGAEAAIVVAERRPELLLDRTLAAVRTPRKGIKRYSSKLFGTNYSTFIIKSQSSYLQTKFS